jgi:hypothetical protein
MRNKTQPRGGMGWLGSGGGMSKTRHAQGRHVPLSAFGGPLCSNAHHGCTMEQHEAEPMLKVETETPRSGGPDVEQRFLRSATI